MGGWLAKIVALFGVELIQRLMGPLIAAFNKWVAEQAQKKQDEAKTAEVLKKVQDAKTEQEIIDAARHSASNSK